MARASRNRDAGPWRVGVSRWARQGGRASASGALLGLHELEPGQPVEQAARGVLERQRQGAALRVDAGDLALDAVVGAVRLAFRHRDLDPGVLLQLADIVLHL